MPVRVTNETDVRRAAARRTAAQLVCAIAAIGLSCDGSVCPPITSSGAITPPSPVLQPRYVLADVGGVALPVTIASGGGVRVRLLADTLTFVGAGTPPDASGTYVETRVVGTQQGAAPEDVARVVSAPRSWRQSATYAALELTAFVGFDGAPGTATMYLGNSASAAGPALIVSAANVSHRFEPR